MKCTMCHPMGETSKSNSTTKSQKGIISYTLANGITIMKKHIVNEHLVVLVENKKHKKALNDIVVGKQKRKKRKVMDPLLSYFLAKIPT